VDAEAVAAGADDLNAVPCNPGNGNERRVGVSALHQRLRWCQGQWKIGGAEKPELETIGASFQKNCPSPLAKGGTFFYRL